MASTFNIYKMENGVEMNIYLIFSILIQWCVFKKGTNELQRPFSQNDTISDVLLAKCCLNALPALPNLHKY